MLKINIRPNSLIIYGLTIEELAKIYRSQELEVTHHMDGIQVRIKHDEHFAFKAELYMLLWKLSTIYDIELV